MARILLIDDSPKGVKFLIDRLSAQGYEVGIATSGSEALDAMRVDPPDLVLLDVVMPGMNGYEVCRAIRADQRTEALPVIMLTALEPNEERVTGLEAGADDFLSTPVHWPELLARVRSLLRIKELHDTVKSQAEKLEELNATLERRVDEQVGHIERLSRLRRFLSPGVAEIIVSEGDSRLQSHRENIAIVCCDLRGFTAFSELAEPEETITVLREYHQSVGQLVTRYEGTIDHFAGDGIMVFFNDPIPCEQPARRAVEMAVSTRDAGRELVAEWRGRGHDLGLAAGVSAGFATIGLVGFEGRYDYAATGRAVNLAARLCERAADGQVLISQPVHREIGDEFAAEFVGALEYKGFFKRIPTYDIAGPKSTSSRE